MAIKKMSKPNLKGGVKSAPVAVMEEPIVEDELFEEELEDDIFEDEANELEELDNMEDDFDYEEDNEEYDDEEKDFEDEEVIEEINPKRNDVESRSKKTEKTVVKKVTTKVTKENKSDKKVLLTKAKTPEEAVVPGKVTKREDLLKIAIKELESKGYTMTLTGMDMVFKAIENAIEFSLENEAPVFLLGNQISVKERSQRVAHVPSKDEDYYTLTSAYTAFAWSKLGERETIRGKYNKEKKIFKADDGTIYVYNEKEKTFKPKKK